MHRLLLSLIFLSISASPASGEPITVGHTETLHSKILDEERTLSIALPEDYKTTETRHPVLYILGAHGNFLHTLGIVQTLTRNGHLPSMILVAIANTARTRDFAPPWTRPNPPPEIQRFIRQAGGADRFLQFLTEELVPHIEGSYRTAPFRILVGHSLGGLFTLRTLLTQPNSFDGYLAISPSTHWDEDLVLREVDDFLQQELPSPRFLFLSLANEGGDGLDNYRQLVERLEYEAPENLHWAQKELPEEDHGSVRLRATQLGLETIFRGWNTPSHLEGSLEGLEKHYSRLSKRYGYDIPVPESKILAIGYLALVGGDNAEAIRIFSHNLEQYPRSANANYRLGQALAADGQNERALELYERAVAVAAETEDPSLSFYRQQRDDLAAAAADPE